METESDTNTKLLDEVFPHLGEIILQRILEHSPELIANARGIQVHDLRGIHRQIPLAFPKTEIIFDGFSTLDLGVHLSDGSLFPIEAKLGFTGLARASMNTKLASCSISGHQSEYRVSGKIPAVLNRNFDEQLRKKIANDRLHGWLGGHWLPITEAWATIARDHVIASWTNYPPAFNGKHRTISLNQLCSKFGKMKFNQVVSELFANIDYYDRWIGS